MNKDDLNSALTDVRDSFIMEADPAKEMPIPFIRRYRGVLSTAAALAAVIGITVLISNRLHFNGYSSATSDSAVLYSESAAAEEAEEQAEDAAVENIAVGMTLMEESAAAKDAEEASDEEYLESSCMPEMNSGNSGSGYDEAAYLDAVYNQVLVWNGTLWYPVLEELESEIPDGWNYEFDVSDRDGEGVYSENSYLTGYPCYVSAEDHSCFYVWYDTGFQRYETEK